MKVDQASRRQMLKSLLGGALAIPVLSALFAKRGMSQAPTPNKFVDEKTDPVAKALKYNPDATKAPERTVEKQGVKPDQQSCSNCALFTKQPNVDGKEAGKCTMIQAGLVSPHGWCMSWAKKA